MSESVQNLAAGLVAAVIVLVAAVVIIRDEMRR